MKTKNNSQKIVSAKIVEKLVELANKYVVPCININMPGRYSASQLDDEKDALGNKLYWGIDADKCDVSQIEVTIAESDFSEEELEELGYSPKFKLSIQNLMVFRAIAKYEQLAGLRSANRAKFVVGEPATIYETERAKVVLYERKADTIVTKTKKITIISDTQAVYKQDKETITLCLKINGKWFAVHTLSMEAYDFETIVENVLKKYTIDNIRKGVKATANSQVCNKFVEFCRLIQSGLDEMDKLNAETADSTGNDTNEPKAIGNAVQSEQRQNDADTPPKDSVKPINQCGRKSAVLSDFRGKGDKVYRQSGENRNLGIYCGKNEVLSAEVRGSPQKRNDKQHT